MEKDMKLIAQGEKSYELVLEQEKREMKDIFLFA